MENNPYWDSRMPETMEIGKVEGMSVGEQFPLNVRWVMRLME